MAATSANLAITKDGETYNKLQRPDDYLTAAQVGHKAWPAPKPTAVGAGKRKHDNHAADSSKRQRAGERLKKQASSHRTNRAIPPLSENGMRVMLPGLEDLGSSSNGTMDEAVAYLRSVQAEASLIPDLLVAPVVDGTTDAKNPDTIEIERAAYDDGSRNGERLVFHEGVLMAIDGVDNELDETDDSSAGQSDTHVQQACHKMLLKRFRSLQLRLTDALSHYQAQEARENSHDAGRASTPQSKRGWADLIESSYPTLNCISQLSRGSMLLAVEGCTSSLSRSPAVNDCRSCWIWTLLALIGGEGTLDLSGMSRIRDLGIQAGRLGQRLRSVLNHSSSVQNDASELQSHGNGPKATQSSQECGRCDPSGYTNSNSDNHNYNRSSERSGTGVHMSTVSDSDGAPLEDEFLSNAQGHNSFHENASLLQGDGEVSTQETAGLEEARARLLHQLSDRLVPKIDLQEQASIDTILTIVAECYGQRDLLQAYRMTW